MKQAICNLFRGTKYYVVARKFFGFAIPKKKDNSAIAGPWNRKSRPKLG